jgi:hypothetical protein
MAVDEWNRPLYSGKDDGVAYSREEWRDETWDNDPGPDEEDEDDALAGMRALEEENARLRAENAVLRAKKRGLRPSPVRRLSGSSR